MKKSTGMRLERLNIGNCCLGVLTASLTTCLLALIAALGINEGLINFCGLTWCTFGIYILSAMSGVVVALKCLRNCIIFNTLSIVLLYYIVLAFTAVIIFDQALYVMWLNVIPCALGGALGWYVGNIKYITRNRRRGRGVH